MAIQIDGSNLRVTASTRGHVFPRGEAEIPFPVLVDAIDAGRPIQVEGSLYGHSVRLVGDVQVGGPVVARGDVVLEPVTGCVACFGGLNAGESISVRPTAAGNMLSAGVDKATVLVRGDLVARNVYLENAIVFGSIRAGNCSLKSCIVLGTVTAAERLVIASSTVGGYAARDVTFEGACMMIHSIGESTSRPVFGPAETLRGVQACEVRYYPGLRDAFGIVNLADASYPRHSLLAPAADWVQVQVRSPESGEVRQRWVLSLGGRLSDVRTIQQSIGRLSAMLKCGFEFDHYLPTERARLLEAALIGLNADETWILRRFCRQAA